MGNKSVFRTVAGRMGVSARLRGCGAYHDAARRSEDLEAAGGRGERANPVRRRINSELLRDAKFARATTPGRDVNAAGSIWAAGLSELRRELRR